MSAFDGTHDLSNENYVQVQQPAINTGQNTSEEFVSDRFAQTLLVAEDAIMQTNAYIDILKDMLAGLQAYVPETINVDAPVILPITVIKPPAPNFDDANYDYPPNPAIAPTLDPLDPIIPLDPPPNDAVKPPALAERPTLEPIQPPGGGPNVGNIPVPPPPDYTMPDPPILTDILIPPAPSITIPPWEDEFVDELLPTPAEFNWQESPFNSDIWNSLLDKTLANLNNEDRYNHIIKYAHSIEAGEDATLTDLIFQATIQTEIEELVALYHNPETAITLEGYLFQIALDRHQAEIDKLSARQTMEFSKLTVMQDEIYARAREQVRVANDKAYREVEEYFAARNFPLPPGAMAGRLAEVSQEISRNERDMAGKIMIDMSDQRRKDTYTLLEMVQKDVHFMLDAVQKNALFMVENNQKDFHFITGTNQENARFMITSIMQVDEFNKKLNSARLEFVEDKNLDIDKFEITHRTKNREFAELYNQKDRLGIEELNQKGELAILDANIRQDQFSSELARQLEAILRDFHNAQQNRSLEAAKAVAQHSIAIVNAYIARYNARIDKYKADAMIYTEQVKALLIEVELYKAEMEGAKVAAEVQKLQVDVYTAQIEAINTIAKMYATQLEGSKILADLERLKIDVFKAEIEIYLGKLQGQKITMDIYAVDVNADKTQVQAYGEEIRAYTSAVQANKAIMETEIANLEAKVKTNLALVEEYKALLQSWGIEVDVVAKRIEGDTRVYEAEVKGYTAEVSAEVSYHNGQLKQIDNTIQQARFNLELEVARVNSVNENYMALQELSLKGTEGVMSVTAQLAASALSAVNASASYGFSGSRSHGTSWSFNAAASESHSFLHDTSIAEG